MTNKLKNDLSAFMMAPENVWPMREQGTLATFTTLKSLRTNKKFENKQAQLDECFALKPKLIKACKKQDEEQYTALQAQLSVIFKSMTAK